VRFNCTEDFSLSAVNRYLSGVIQSGSWALFTDVMNLNPGLFHICSSNWILILICILTHLHLFSLLALVFAVHAILPIPTHFSLLWSVRLLFVSFLPLFKLF